MARCGTSRPPPPNICLRLPPPEVRMDEVTLRRMTVAEFFAWEPGDEERYELVDGRPVKMTGARRRHDRIVGNLNRVLGTQLLDSPYIVFTPDTAVLIPNG